MVYNMFNVGKYRNKSICQYTCLTQSVTKIRTAAGVIIYKRSLNPAIEQLSYVEKNPCIARLKSTVGGKPVYIKQNVNNFGRLAGTGGNYPNNFR